MHIRGGPIISAHLCVALIPFAKLPISQLVCYPHVVQCVFREYSTSWLVLPWSQPFGEEYYPNRVNLPLIWGFHYTECCCSSSYLLLTEQRTLLTAAWTEDSRPASQLKSLRVEVKWLSADPDPLCSQVSAMVTYRKPNRTVLCVACPACPPRILTQQQKAQQAGPP